MRDNKSQRRSVGRSSGSNSKKTRPPRNELRNDLKQSPFSIIPAKDQQAIVNVFSRAFPRSHIDNLQGTIQNVKKHLFARDFHSAFVLSELNRSAYALRWSPSRAIVYATILEEQLEFLSQAQCDEIANTNAESELQVKSESQCPQISNQRHARRLVCVGAGGGAELVALHYIASRKSRRPGTDTEAEAEAEAASDGQCCDTGNPFFECTLVDIADWSSVMGSLQDALGRQDSMSRHVRHVIGPTQSDRSLGSDRFVENTSKLQEVSDKDQLNSRGNTTTEESASCRIKTTFKQHDILEHDSGALDLQFQFEQANLVTIFFTLNELYTASIAKTTAFLLKLTDTLKPGARLLIVDSPGSYSTVKFGNANANSTATTTQTTTATTVEKEPEPKDMDENHSSTSNTDEADANCKTTTQVKHYQMHWLLEHTLFDLAPAASSDSADPSKLPKWRKLEECQHRWFRLDKNIKYQVDLEDMRCQIHLFERI